MTEELVEMFDITSIANMNKFDALPTWEEYVEGLRNSPHKSDDIEAVLNMDIGSIEEISLANSLNDFISVTTEVIGPYILNRDTFEKIFGIYNNRMSNIVQKYIEIEKKIKNISVEEFTDRFYEEVIHNTPFSYMGIFYSRLESAINKEIQKEEY